MSIDRFSDVCPACEGVGFHRMGCAVSHVAPTNQQLAETALAAIMELERRGNKLTQARNELADFYSKIVQLKNVARSLGVSFREDA